MTMRKTSITTERDNQLKEAFALFDRLGGGTISVKDLSFVMNSMGYQPTTSQLEQMIREVDRDGNGLIDFEEFKLMMNNKFDSRLEIFNDELLSEAFRIFDKDGDGLITKTEIHCVMSSLGEHLTDEELNAMINEADLDGNRQVDYGEFAALVRRILQIQSIMKSPSTNFGPGAYQGRGIIPFIDDDLDEDSILRNNEHRQNQ